MGLIILGGLVLQTGKKESARNSMDCVGICTLAFSAESFWPSFPFPLSPFLKDEKPGWLCCEKRPKRVVACSIWQKLSSQVTPQTSRHRYGARVRDAMPCLFSLDSISTPVRFNQRGLSRCRARSMLCSLACWLADLTLGY